jgi:hypothetical protein
VGTLENQVLRFRLGDTWVSPIYAVLIDDLPADLTPVSGHWSVKCQAKRTPTSPVLQEWTTENGRIIISDVQVQYSTDNIWATTSAIRLFHTADDSQDWNPFSAYFEIELERYEDEVLERFTLVTGRMIAKHDIAESPVSAIPGEPPLGGTP